MIECLSDPMRDRIATQSRAGVWGQTDLGSHLGFAVY